MLAPARGKYSHSGIDLLSMHKDSAFYPGPLYFDSLTICSHECLLEAGTHGGDIVHHPPFFF